MYGIIIETKFENNYKVFTYPTTKTTLKIISNDKEKLEDNLIKQGFTLIRDEFIKITKDIEIGNRITTVTETAAVIKLIEI